MYKMNYYLPFVFVGHEIYIFVVLVIQFCIGTLIQHNTHIKQDSRMGLLFFLVNKDENTSIHLALVLGPRWEIIV